MLQRSCDQCEKQYKYSHPTSKYCSRHCSDNRASHREVLGTRVCNFCAESYEYKSVLSKYCSRSCKDKNSVRQRGFLYDERPCEICDEFFQPFRKNTKRCSDDKCRSIRLSTRCPHKLAFSACVECRPSREMCSRCGMYERHTTETGKVRSTCLLCIREKRLLTKYGLTQDAFNLLLVTQHNCCKICRKEFSFALKDGRKATCSSPHVDHDHTTGLVRGLLCKNCNLGIGYFQDNADILADAIAYLLSNKSILPIHNIETLIER